MTYWCGFCLLCLIVVIDAGLEHALVDAADGAYPVIREVFKRRSGFDAVFGIAFFGIVCVATRITEIFFHSWNSFRIMYLGLTPTGIIVPHFVPEYNSYLSGRLFIREDALKVRPVFSRRLPIVLSLPLLLSSLCCF